MAIDLTPKTSGTKLPGYVANDPWVQGPSGPVPGGVNHPMWQSTVVDALVTDWVNGGRGLPGGWNSSYGTPDPSDAPGKPASARTITAFSNYVANYKPGASEWIDGNFAYVPPSSTDYVETPEALALRVDQERWDKTFDVQFGPTAQAEKAAALAQHQYEFGENLKIDQARLDMQGSAQAAEAAYQMANLSLQREGMAADAAWRKAQMALEREKMKVGEEQFNKTLALQYENLWLAKEEQADRRAIAVADIQQKRADTLSELGADPGDAVQREFSSRLGTEPLGTPVDVFTGQPGATDSMTLSQVMAGQADKLRPFAQRGFSGSPVNTQSGLVTDPVSVVGDNPSGQPSGTEEILLNPTQAPFGVVSNKDVKKMGLRDVVRGAQVPRRAMGTFERDEARGGFGAFEKPPSPWAGREAEITAKAPGLSDMFRDRMVKGAGYFGVTPDKVPTYPRQMPANMTLPVMPTPRPAGQKFSDFAAMARGRWQDALGRVPRYAGGTGLELADPTVTTQDIGSVTQVEPVGKTATAVVKPAPAATPVPKWNLVTTPAGGAVWYDGTSGKYYDPNTKAEIPSPAGMTKGVPDPITVPAATPPTPPAWNPRPDETYSAANGDQWWVINGQWTYRGNDPKIPPSKIPTTTPGNPNALTPYYGGWWDVATQGPVPTQAPAMNAAPASGSVTNRQRRSLANPGRTLSSILSRRNRGDEGNDDDDPATDSTLADGTVIDRNGRTRGRRPAPGGAPQRPPNWPADVPWPPVGTMPPPGGQVPPGGTTLPPPGGTTQPPPAGATPPPGGSTGNALLDALAQSAGIDILSYGPEVYQALARLLNQPGIAEQLAANGISVPALGLTGDNALPAPNALNYTNLSGLANDAPGTFALLSSLFKAGNQNLPNLMAGVKARAPLGSAYNPSLIQT